MHLGARLTFTSRFKLTENGTPKPDKRADVAATELRERVTPRREKELEGARLRSQPNCHEASNFKAKGPYQNCRKMVEICTHLPETLYSAL
jgi:hypothetical protein